MKKALNRPAGSLFGIKGLPLWFRRGTALALEVSLIAACGLVPYGLGEYIDRNSSSELVPLNPVLVTTQSAIAQTLATPLRDKNKQVPPLTNWFWTAALITPALAFTWQLYSLKKTGQTLPKRWLGVQAIAASGTPPGLLKGIIREGLGRWVIPIGIAYGIWRSTVIFPDLGLLVGVAGLTLLGENAIALFDPKQRTFHDRIAGTLVVIRDGNRIFDKEGNPITLEVEGEPTEKKQPIYSNQEKNPAMALTVLPKWQQWRLWGWMGKNPGLALLLGGVVTLTSVLGTFVGIQVYIQSQANRRELKQQNNQAFLEFVKQLSATSSDSVPERRAAILALSTLDDPRVVPFLVDLLGQEKNTELMDTIAQALVSNGPVSLFYLQRLNQSFTNDLEAASRRGSVEEQQTIALQRRASQEAIAKILTIYSTQVHDADLSRVSLEDTTFAPFSLVLDRMDLSGINFRSAILSRASLQNTRFYGSGKDGHFSTFDDWIADLSGADLKEANLSGALLSHVVMNRTNLIRATLSKSDFSSAILTGANLSSAQIIQADFRKAVLRNAILTGASLAESNFTNSDLQGARFAKTNAVGTQFAFAKLVQSDWTEADLSSANLGQADLQNADLSLTKLVGANLSKAQLQNANLRNADLSQADLRGANVAGADFQGATFADAKPDTSDAFIETLPSTASAARVDGVDFSLAKNLDPKQISYICSQGGLHPQCP